MNFVTEEGFDFSQFNNVEHKKSTPICQCDREMKFAEQNGMKIYFCNICGESIQYQEEIMEKSNKFNAKYKKILGDKSKKTIAEKITAKLLKAKFPISSVQLDDILQLCEYVSSSKSPRSDPRTGLIAACSARVLPISKSDAAKIFGVEQKHVSSGINKLNKAVNYYKSFDFREECSKLILKYWAKFFSGDPHPEIAEILSLCRAYNIGVLIPIKTRVIGAIWLVLKLKKINFSERQFCEKIEVQKETFMKFYREFIICLWISGRHDGQYAKELEFRYFELRRYFQSRKIEVPPMSLTIKLVDVYKKKYL